VLTQAFAWLNSASAAGSAGAAAAAGWAVDTFGTHGGLAVAAIAAGAMAVLALAGLRAVRALGDCKPRQQAAPRPAAADGLGAQSRLLEQRQADDAVARGAAIAECRYRRPDSDPLH
jgi:hypothetical protein